MLYKNKPRKILNLEERVQAIRMYDRHPVYQRVATIFHCSWEQIKNIVSNRDTILAYYARCQIIDGTDGPRQVRRKKINFLGNAMYEYIKRAHYHKSTPINDDIIRQKAAEFRDLIKIEKFHPNHVWIHDFKQVYNIDFDRPDSILVTERPHSSLNCGDIIAYCGKEVKKAGKTEATTDAATDATSTMATTINEGNLKEGSLDEYYEPVDMEENTDDLSDDTDISDGFVVDDYLHFGNDLENDYDEIYDATALMANDETNGIEDDETTAKNSTTPKLNNVEDSVKINSYRAALTSLRPLEEFALDQEDFRAINLLSQLSEYYEKSMNKGRKIRQTKNQ